VGRAVEGGRYRFVLVGDSRGAKTKRLAEICRRTLGPTHHVEGLGELNPSWFSGKGRIGDVGRASIPGWGIAEVVDGLR
jgi:4-hydroxy-3-methylbut-2-enyl diphosphate reductase IspH